MSITFKNLSYQYAPGTPFAYTALKDISFTLETGKIIAIIGATGSGKTTLVQHLNALLLPTSGSLSIEKKEITSKEKPKNLKSLRKQVGLVFQFPEYQLFEETILKDVCFGPLNFAVEEQAALAIAKDCLRLVGIDEEYYERSPLDLSGGQKRRVAIAGILALDPNILVLDEPTAGLDPQGSQSMMNLFKSLNRELNKTILVVTHDMEHVLNYCDEVIVLDKGEFICQKEVKDFFSDIELLNKLNIKLPILLSIQESLKQNGFKLLNEAFDINTLANAISSEVLKNE